MFICKCVFGKGREGIRWKKGSLCLLYAWCLFTALSLQEIDFPPSFLQEYSIDVEMINCSCQGLIGYVEHWCGHEDLVLSLWWCTIMCQGKLAKKKNTNHSFFFIPATLEDLFILFWEQPLILRYEITCDIKMDAPWRNFHNCSIRRRKMSSSSGSWKVWSNSIWSKRKQKKFHFLDPTSTWHPLYLSWWTQAWKMSRNHVSPVSLFLGEIAD